MPAAPPPAFLKRGDRSGFDRHAFGKPVQLLGQFFGGRIAILLVALETLQADSLQVFGHGRIQLARRRRILVNLLVNDGGRVDDVLANAPESASGFFVVPKVVE